MQYAKRASVSAFSSKALSAVFASGKGDSNLALLFFFPFYLSRLLPVSAILIVFTGLTFTLLVAL